MAGARLVHEGAVLTGPHGGRGSVRGAAHGSVLLEAWKLHSDRACGGRETATRRGSSVAGGVWRDAPPAPELSCTAPRANGGSQREHYRRESPARTQNPAQYTTPSPVTNSTPPPPSSCAVSMAPSVLLLRVGPL